MRVIVKKLFTKNGGRLKQVILVRADLKLPKGKLAAQVAHASVDAVLKSNKHTVAAWRHDGMPKVVLKVKSVVQLKQFQRQARLAGLVNSLITDAGHTVVKPGTITCLAVGPNDERKIDKLTRELSLL